jgi:co-chaperonin GroES (HSP10)
MDINIIPVGPHLLIDMGSVEEKTAGGIIIPEKSRDQQELSSTKGVVVALGAEAFADYMEGTPIPEQGDQVIVARYAGIKLEDGNQRICKDQDVIAVLKRKE